MPRDKWEQMVQSQFYAGFLFVFLPLATLAVPSPRLPVKSQWELLLPKGATGSFDASALFLFQGRFLTLSDKDEYPDLYTFRLNPNAATLPLASYFPMRPALVPKDFEGVAYCHGRFWLADEGERAIVELSRNGKATRHRVELSTIHAERGWPNAFGMKNAGFEAIACNEKENLFYIANERQFRMIYVVDRKTFKAIDFFDVPAGDTLPRYENDQPIYPDFSDFHFESGFLYALQRNDDQVLKIDVRTKNRVAAISLDINETDHYDTTAPYGMAEGLTMNRDSIFIILDNNNDRLKSTSRSPAPVLLQFIRPPGF